MVEWSHKTAPAPKRKRETRLFLSEEEKEREIYKAGEYC